MKNLLSFFKRLNSQVIIFFSAIIIVALAIIYTNSNQVIEVQNTNTNISNIPNSEVVISSDNNNNYNSLVVSDLDKSEDKNQNITTASSNPNLDLNNNNIAAEGKQTSLNSDSSLYKNNYLQNEKKTQAKNYLGHFTYQEANRQNLVLVGNYYGRDEFLEREAAEAFNQMKLSAKNSGINLIIISGFRSIESQKQLFQKQIQKQGTKEAAARLSAPPGHSEHHTGYALDIGDEKQPLKDLKFEFENTKAFEWLLMNGVTYGFELSFPKNNNQQVSFEPWHWRYIGSPKASEIFAATRGILNN